MSIAAIVARMCKSPQFAPCTTGVPEPQSKFVALDAQGIAATADLVEYVTLARVSKFRKQVASVLKLAGDETYWGVYDVRSTSLLFAAAPSHVVSMFMSAALLAEDPDSGASLVADWRTGEVASYLFNDVAPVDPEPADYFVVAPSVAAWLAQGGDDADHRPVRGAWGGMAARYRRSIWLAQIMSDPDYAGDDPSEIVAAVRDAAPLATYALERESLTSDPGLAAYWLLTHAVLGRSAELADALQQTSGARAAWLCDVRAAVAPMVHDAALVKSWLAEHHPDWPAGTLARIRKAAQRTA
jgi:hypothetical protein